MALFAAINVSGLAGNKTIVTAVANKEIMVLGYTIIASASETIVWYSGAEVTALSGTMTFQAATGGSTAYHGQGVMITAAGEALTLTTGTGSVTLGGHLTYALMSG